MFFIRRWRKFYYCKNRLQADRVCELFDEDNIRYKLNSKETAAQTEPEQPTNSHTGNFTFRVYWRDYKRAREHEVFRDLPNRMLR